MPLFWKKAQDIDRSSLEAVVNGNTRFALDLYHELRSTEGNLFFSPISISTTLAMTYAGACGNTQIQIAQALHFPADRNQLHSAFALLAARLMKLGQPGHIQLRAANTLWPRVGYEFLKEYLSLAKKNYGVQITSIDFGDEEAARCTINAWVEEKTDRKIKDLIPVGVLDNLTRMVLVNAIYFKGDWRSQFDPQLTTQTPFFTDPNGQVQVPMMALKHAFRYAESESLQILELPYAGEALSMLVLLPREKDGLGKLEESFALENLDKWMSNLAELEVNVFLPRFELAFPFRLDVTLKSMGMLEAFSSNADFSGMDGTRELYIGAALHKAFVAVNEQGTEAAAATAVIMQLKAVSFPSIVFRADHPFVFVIRENDTGSILFIGRVVNPA
jgi:serine protease inhibitor